MGRESVRVSQGPRTTGAVSELTVTAEQAGHVAPVPHDLNLYASMGFVPTTERMDGGTEIVARLPLVVEAD